MALVRHADARRFALVPGGGPRRLERAGVTLATALGLVALSAGTAGASQRAVAPDTARTTSAASCQWLIGSTEAAGRSAKTKAQDESMTVRLDFQKCVSGTNVAWRVRAAVFNYFNTTQRDFSVALKDSTGRQLAPAWHPVVPVRHSFTTPDFPVTCGVHYYSDFHIHYANDDTYGETWSVWPCRADGSETGEVPFPPPGTE